MIAEYEVYLFRQSPHEQLKFSMQSEGFWVSNENWPAPAVERLKYLVVWNFLQKVAQEIFICLL